MVTPEELEALLHDPDPYRVESPWNALHRRTLADPGDVLDDIVQLAIAGSDDDDLLCALGAILLEPLLHAGGDDIARPLAALAAEVAGLRKALSCAWDRETLTAEGRVWLDAVTPGLGSEEDVGSRESD